MYKPVLHVSDDKRRYQAAHWLPPISADAVLTAIRFGWIDVYLKILDVINHDAGKMFFLKVFQAIAHLLLLDTKSVQ